MIGMIIITGGVNTCIILALLSILIKEVAKMRKRAIRDDEALIQTTTYIVVTVIVYHIFLLHFPSILLALQEYCLWLDLTAIWLGMLYGYILIIRRQAVIFIRRPQEVCQSCKMRNRVQPRIAIVAQPSNC